MRNRCRSRRLVSDLENWIDSRTKDLEVEYKGRKGLKKVYTSLKVKWISTMRWSLRDVNWNCISFLHSSCFSLYIYIYIYSIYKSMTRGTREKLSVLTASHWFHRQRIRGLLSDRSVLLDIAMISENTLRFVIISHEIDTSAWERKTIMSAQKRTWRVDCRFYAAPVNFQPFMSWVVYI